MVDLLGLQKSLFLKISGLVLLSFLLQSCGQSATTPVPTKMPMPTNTSIVRLTNTPAVFTPTVSLPTHTPTATATSTKIPDAKLETVMNELDEYFVLKDIVMPQRGREIFDWANSVAHLDDVEAYYPCMVSPVIADTWNWKKTRRCINTIDDYLNELDAKLRNGGYNDLDGFGLLENAREQLSELYPLAEYEDRSKYIWKVDEVAQVLGALYSNAIQTLPETMGYSARQPTYGFMLTLREYYLFTDNNSISSDEDVYAVNSLRFGQFFVNEHNRAKRIFTVELDTGIANSFGIFEYETPEAAEAALNRLYGLVGVADQTFNIVGDEYRMIFWKVPEWNQNNYALVTRRGRYLIIADPDSEIKDSGNFVLLGYVIPLLN